MLKYFFSIIILIVFFSCKQENNSSQSSFSKTISSKNPDTASQKKFGFYTFDGDSMLVPPFEIEISLSPKAKERIVNGNETIVVDVFLEGIPKEAYKVHLEEDGSFYVGSLKKEILYGQIARFNNLKFPRKIYDQLADKDVQLTVNVYSGRKSSKDNLITVDFLSNKVSNIINKHFILKGQLIYNDN